MTYIYYSVDKTVLGDMSAAFIRKVTDTISSAVPYKEEDFIIAMELFTAVARKDSYDERGDDLNYALIWSPYRSIMEDTGICQEIAGEYIYYLLQTGINATTCSGLSRDKSFAHAWALVKLGEKYYHMDPTFTVDYPDSLLFFGMNDISREHYGDLPAENFTYCNSDALSPAEFYADSDRFKELWLARSYTIDHTNEKIITTRFSINADGSIDPDAEGETYVFKY